MGKTGCARGKLFPATDDRVIDMAVFLSLDRQVMEEGYARGAIRRDKRALDRRKDTSKMTAVS
jgi:hypothetical protein